MNNFEVNIDHEAFDRAGVQAFFDTDAYSELLAIEAGPDKDTPYFQITIKPRYDFALSIIERWKKDSEDPDAMLKASRGGEYSIGTNEILVNAVPNSAHTNSALLHETKHWLDDTEDALIVDVKNMVAERNARHASRRFGQNALLLLDHYHYQKSAHERRARAFSKVYAADERFKSIITYK